MRFEPRQVNGWSLLLALTLLLGVAHQAWAADALVGRWVNESQFVKNEFVFLPDGRYAGTMTAGTYKTSDSGRYGLEGDTLSLRAQQGGARQLKIALQGDQMALSDGTTQMVYTRVPGSAEAVAAEAVKGDQAQGQEDAAWAARFPVGPARPQPNIAAGLLPVDPQPARVFDGAIAFTAMQLYYRHWNPNVTYQVTEGPDPGSGKNETRLHFLPNGRFYYVSIRYTPQGAVQGGRQRARAEVTTSWGRYTIAAATPAGEPFQMESDAGERIAAALVSGRRNLQWGQNLFGNLVWEQAAFQHYQQHGGQVGVGVPLPAAAPQPAQPIQPANPEAAARLRVLQEKLETIRAAEARILADPNSSSTERLALRQVCLDIEREIEQLRAGGALAPPR